MRKWECGNGNAEVGIWNVERKRGTWKEGEMNDEG